MVKKFKKWFSSLGSARTVAVILVIFVLSTLFVPFFSLSTYAATNAFTANVGIFIDDVSSLTIYDSLGTVTTLNTNNTNYTFTYPTNTSPTITSTVQGGVTRYSARYNVTVNGYYSQYMLYEVGSSGSGGIYSSGENAYLQNGVNVMFYGSGDRSTSLQTVSLTLIIYNIQNYGYVPPTPSIPSLDDTWILLDKELDYNGVVDVELDATFYYDGADNIYALYYNRGILETYGDHGDYTINSNSRDQHRLIYIESIDESQTDYSAFYSFVSTNAAIITDWDNSFTEWLHDSLDESFNSGYTTGYNDASGVGISAYDKGYQDGYTKALSESLGNMMLDPIAALFDFELMPNITIGGIFAAILGISLVLLFLKYFAGG